MKIVKESEKGAQKNRCAHTNSHDEQKCDTNGSDVSDQRNRYPIFKFHVKLLSL